MTRDVREPAEPDCAVTESPWRPKPGRVYGGRAYARWVVPTHVVRPGERLTGALSPYLAHWLKPHDIVAVSEKVVAVTQGRSVLLQSIRPGRIAVALARHVSQRGYGLGLHRAETMEMAIREAGLLRILVAAAAAALTRPLGRRGDFYRVAGRRVAAIDGPGPTTLPPYNHYVVLAPDHPDAVARTLSRRLRAGVAVVDINDVGSEVLAVSPGVDAALVRRILDDNPMGQGTEQTPVAVIRPLDGPTESFH